MLAVLVSICAAVIDCGASFAQEAETKAAEPVIKLSPVQVIGEKDDGTSKDGYVVRELEEIGPWGGRQLLDTPYSITVIPAPLMENMQAKNAGDIIRRAPNVTGGWASESNQITAITSRGLWMTSRNIINGVQLDNVGLGVFIEDVESMEILSGLSGFMYGQGNVGGLVNYKLKRPTEEFFNSVKIGGQGGEQYYAHADSGGQIIKNKLGYRLNVMALDGRTSVEHQRMNKKFVSGAVDWSITKSLLMQANASYGEVDMKGRQGAFTIGDNNSFLHGAPDPSKLWVSDDTGNEIEVTTLGLGVKYDINDFLKARAAYAYRKTHRRSIITGSSFVSGTDNYTYRVVFLDWEYASNGAHAYLDANFDTLGIAHKLTTGVNGYESTNSLGRFRNLSGTYGLNYQLAGLSGSFNNNSLALNHDLSGLRVFEQYYAGRAKNSETLNYNFMIGDEITFNDQWMLMAGANYATIGTKAYNAAGDGRRTSDYRKRKWTPTASALFKPVPKITTYATYMESLENGTIVGPTYANAGEHLDPLMSEQYEMGVKADIYGVMLTGALFHIDKGLQYADTSINRYVQDGRQRHRGIELTARGKIFDSLNLMGGFTYLDAEVRKSSTPRYEGKRPQYVPKTLAKLYLEYELPFIKGLALTGGMYFNGNSMANNDNTARISPHTTGDIGMRYVMQAYGIDGTLRLTVNNVTDKAYWVGERGSDVILGDPRTILFSLECVF
jgi:iron complex outermembrane receptor protein